MSITTGYSKYTCDDSEWSLLEVVLSGTLTYVMIDDGYYKKWYYQLEPSIRKLHWTENTAKR